jgi:hypothetical protein
MSSWREIEPLKKYKLGKTIHECGEDCCELREFGSRYSVCPISRRVHNVVFQHEDDDEEEEDHTVEKKHVDPFRDTKGKERIVRNMFNQLYNKETIKHVVAERVLLDNVPKEPKERFIEEVKRRMEFTKEEIDIIIKHTLSIDHPKLEQVFLAVCYTLAGHPNGVIMQRAAWCTPPVHKLASMTPFKMSDLTEGLEVLNKHPLVL